MLNPFEGWPQTSYGEGAYRLARFDELHRPCHQERPVGLLGLQTRAEGLLAKQYLHLICRHTWLTMDGSPLPLPCSPEALFLDVSMRYAMTPN